MQQDVNRFFAKLQKAAHSWPSRSVSGVYLRHRPLAQTGALGALE
jgi:hypothetical protein